MSINRVKPTALAFCGKIAARRAAAYAADVRPIELWSWTEVEGLSASNVSRKERTGDSSPAVHA
jgi:hypothetical protein